MGAVSVGGAGTPQSARWTAGGPRIEPATILQGALLLLVVSNLGRIPLLDLGNRSAPLLVNDIAVMGVLAATLLTAFRRRSLWLDDVACMGLLFAAIGAGSALFAMPRFGLSGIEIVASLAYLVRWAVYFALYAAVINFVQPRHVESAWNALEWTMLVFAAFGIVQSIFLPNFAQMVYPDRVGQWDVQGNRLVSTVLEPNVAAAMILTVLLTQVARLSSGVKMPMWKPLLMLVALVLTLSRSGIGALLVGGAVILLARGLNLRVLRLGVLAFIGLLVALPKLIAFGAIYSRFGVGDSSAAARVVVWLQALALWLDNFWFGIGFNTYGFVMERLGFERTSGASYSAEGGLLFVAVMTGVVGLTVFAAMLWFVIRRCRAGWRDPSATPSERGLCVGAAAVTVAVVAHSVFVNSLLVPFVMEPLFVLWGLAAVSRSRMLAARARGD